MTAALRVAFDARVLERPELAERGIGRYAGSLLRALEDDGRDVVALRRLRRPPAPARLAELAEHVMLGRDARRVGADVVHSPAIDLSSSRMALPYVMTVHDLVPLKRPGDYLRTGLKHRLRYRAAARATRVIVPTKTVASDCQALLGVAADRIAVVAEAAAPVFRPTPDPRSVLTRFELPERFLLWVGGLDPPDPRKGVGAVAASVARGDGAPLVLAGRAGPEATALAAPGRVFLTGRVSDAELAALYTAADALVFPSDDEGYGLPVAEALACGTPAAAYAIPALTEQYDGRADVALAEPGDTAALLAAAESLAGAAVAAPARTWSDVAADTWRVYEACR